MMNVGALRGTFTLVVIGCLMTGCASTPPTSPAPAPAPVPSPPPVAEKVSYATDAFFLPASTTLSPTAKARLNELAAKTQGQNLEVIIAVGHASAGEAPSPAAIQKLSVQRAEAVKSYLVQLGVERHRVYTEGKGGAHPVADNMTAEGRAKNRRVEIETIGTRLWTSAESVAAPVVYNADLSTQLPRDPAMPNRAVLKAGLPTALNFDIGPKSATSLLPGVPVSGDIAHSTVDVPLTVVLACGFCEPGADALKRMTFRPREGRSDKVHFQFTPQRRPEGRGYVGKLYLAIINDQTGREYDRLMLPVSVASEGRVGHSSPGTAAVLAPSAGLDRTDWRPDVLLYATIETDRNVTISIQPVSAAMKQLLGPLAFDAQGVRRVFQSGIDDPQLIEAMTNSAYGAMSAVSLQGELLKKLSATGVDAAVSPESQASLALSDAEASKVAGVIAQTGQSLYRRLFYDSVETDLRKLVQQLEAAAAAAPENKPLRLMVVTDRLSLPWQYLHPVGPEVNAAKFWGMQFSLSVLRTSNNAREKAVANRTSAVRKIVFARYGSSADPTVPLAEKQAAQLMKLPLAEADLLKVDTGVDLLAKVSAQRKYIGAIVTFLHASAGSGETAPNLQFNDGDIVTSDSLENLLNKVSADEQDLRYLAGGPLVILNACETGPARNLPHVKLQNAMFELGAQGVVVTEVSVWINLGHEVATQLIERLARGEPVADALTAVRRTLRTQKNNPLGLLYVYYGDPAATLRH